MARLGLEAAGPFTVAMANDNDPMKCAAYRANFGDEALIEGDVFDLKPDEILAKTNGQAPVLAWASFPCQDVSLAGERAGLTGKRSSAFFGFWRVIDGLRERGCGPQMLVLENVPGLLTARGGGDFRVIIETLAFAGYHIGAVDVDAVHFTPQSRPRLFIIATRTPPPDRLLFDDHAQAARAMPALAAAYDDLSAPAQGAWVWWRMPPPPERNITLADMLDRTPGDDGWHSPAQTAQLISQMAPTHRARLDEALASGERRVGAVFRRTRVTAGERAVRAEIRFDGIAGCLRTPAGGSSRQIIAVCDRGELRTRLLTPRETARLMGLSEDYKLPSTTTKALHLTGDGVAVPAVAWLTTHVLTPMAQTIAVAA